jgi:hypothetical protein
MCVEGRSAGERLGSSEGAGELWGMLRRPSPCAMRELMLVMVLVPAWSCACKILHLMNATVVSVLPLFLIFFTFERCWGLAVHGAHSTSWQAATDPRSTAAMPRQPSPAPESVWHADRAGQPACKVPMHRGACLKPASKGVSPGSQGRHAFRGCEFRNSREALAVERRTNLFCSFLHHDVGYNPQPLRHTVSRPHASLGTILVKWL